MVKGKNEMTNVKDVLYKNLKTSLSDLSTKLREHGLHAMLLFLSSLPFPVLRIFDIEAYRCYDRNHLMYEKSNRKAMKRNQSNQKANPALKIKTGNK